MIGSVDMLASITIAAVTISASAAFENPQTSTYLKAPHGQVG
jgi:hypothetical protein